VQRALKRLGIPTFHSFSTIFGLFRRVVAGTLAELRLGTQWWKSFTDLPDRLKYGMITE
jgi:hypothetical protein